MFGKPLLALVLALAVSPLAQAQSAPASGSSTPTTAQDSASSTRGSPVKPGSRACLQSTGSLIPAKPGTCLPVAGRSYSAQDLRNTGSPTVGPALQQLDPSITISGGH